MQNKTDFNFKYSVYYMTKVRRIFLFLTTLFFYYVANTTSQNNDIFFLFQDEQVLKAPTSPKPAAGIPDDPGARAKYNLRKIADPSTGRIPENIREKELRFAKKIPSRQPLSFLPKNKLNKLNVPGNLNWQRRGPVNLGGRTRALAIDRNNENIILAGGVTGGLWRSINSGNSWEKVTPVDEIQSVSTIIQDPREGRSNIWYYGTGELIGNSAVAVGNVAFRGDGIFKSVDNGISWAHLDSTHFDTPEFFDNPFNYVWNLAIDPSNTEKDIIFAATIGTIYRSEDGGLSWREIGRKRPENSEYSEVAVSKTGRVYGYISDKSNLQNTTLFRLQTGYPSYLNINQFQLTLINRMKIAISPEDENIVYFLMQTPFKGKTGHTLLKLTTSVDDDGNVHDDWENLTSSIPEFDEDAGGNYNSQGSYNMVLKIHPENADAMFIGGVNLFRSNNAFSDPSTTKWIGGFKYKEPYKHHADQHELAFSPSDPNILYSGHDGGVSVSHNSLSDNVTWNSLNNGYYTTQFYSAAIDLSTPGDNTIIGGMQDNGTWIGNSSNINNNWSELLGGDGGVTYITENKNSYFVSYQEGHVFKFILDENNQTLDWQKIDPVNAEQQLFITPYCIDPFDENVIFYADGNTLWRNSDVSAIPSRENNSTDVNWEKYNRFETYGDISAIAASKSTRNLIYFATGNSTIYRITKANDLNSVPVVLIVDLGYNTSGYISDIEIHPHYGNKLIAVYSNYNVRSLFYSEDFGDTWVSISGNLEEHPGGGGSGPSVKDVSILPISDDSTYYFAATSAGLYSTMELKGDSTIWMLEGEESIGNSIVSTVLTREGDNLVVAATHGGGVFSARASDDWIQPVNLTPANFVLKNNYPNPFNPETTIGFTIKKNGQFNLDIYNILGQKVRSLISNNIYSRGDYKIKFNGLDDFGKQLASGVYFYTLSNSSTAQSKKMILIK